MEVDTGVTLWPPQHGHPQIHVSMHIHVQENEKEGLF